MRRLTLNDGISLSVQQPARYIGGEVNVRVRDLKKVDTRLVTCFPDAYETGTPHLNIQILYSVFNNRGDIHCERVYSPWVDLDPILRENEIPFFTLETQEPVKNLGFLGITLQYEMCYTNVPQILDLSQIPLHTCNRTKNDPIVTGGGPCTYSPEPLVDFFDPFYIGEGETIYFGLMDRYKENKKAGGTRKQFLERAAKIPGIYMLAFYDVAYKKDGTTEYFQSNNEHTTPAITKQTVSDMDNVGYIERPLMSLIKVTQDRAVLEVRRGCIRGYRFCQAGDAYRPLREYNLEYLKHYVYDILRNMRHGEASLSSLSSSDYSQLEGLVNFPTDKFKEKGVDISSPSLRIDASSLDVTSKVQDVEKSSLTSAPETGSQRLWDVINKGLTEETILRGAADAFELGWNRVEPCPMLDLPTETVKDMEGIVLLSEKIAEACCNIPKGQRNGKIQTVAGSFLLVPKPLTPFQQVRMCAKEEFIKRVNIVRDKFCKTRSFKGLKYSWYEVKLTVLGGVLARDGRRVGAVIEETYRTGVIYDPWSEYSKSDVWMRAFETYGVDIRFYTTRKRGLDEVSPWDLIDVDMSEEFLICERDHAVKERVTPNCRQRRSGCGARDFGCGVCYETVKEQDK